MENQCHIPLFACHLTDQNNKGMKINESLDTPNYRNEVVKFIYIYVTCQCGFIQNR